MNVQIRVMAQQAMRQLALLQARLAELGIATAGTGRTSTAASATSVRALRSIDAATARTRAGWLGLGGAIGTVSARATRLQTLGRQVSANITLPLVIAGVAATKFALDNEAAMVRVRKVYGDASMSSRQVKSETDALAKSFEALSERFGVAQKDTIGIAADWAAAGATGVALGKSVELTMQTMVLGEMEASETTRALIAIQAQYGLTVAQLSQTIDQLNMVENQTGASMKDLITGFTRASGVARTAGVDTRHLAAMMAALVPATGSAASAGNGLKTMISRLLAPTKDAAAVMGMMGINTKDLSWQTANGTQKIEMMAKSFEKLNNGQKVAASSTIASRYQISRFEVLMRDIVNTNGYYQKALKSTSSTQDNYNQKVRELNAVLESNPQRLKQIWVMLQNASADIIQPMIPMLLWLVDSIRKMAQAFANLNPSVQKLAVGFLLLLAAVGPVAKLLSAIRIVFLLLGAAMSTVIAPILAVVGAMFKLLLMPFKLISAGISGISVAFKFMGAVGKAAIGSVITGLLRLAMVSSGVLGRTALSIVTLFGSTIPVAMSRAMTTIAANMWAIGVIVLGTISDLIASVFMGTLIPGIMRYMTILRNYLMVTALGLGSLLGGAMSTAFTAIGRVAMAAFGPLRAVFVAGFQIVAGSMILFGQWLSAGMLTAGAALWRAGAIVMATLNLGMRGALVATGQGLVMVWQTINAAIMVIWTQGLLMLESLTVTIGAGIQRAWLAVQVGLSAITAAGGRAWRAVYGGVMFALEVITVTIAGRISLIWWGMMAFMSSPARMLGLFLRAFAMIPVAFAAVGPAMGRVALMLGRFLIGPWGLAIAGVVTLITVFRKQIVQIWDNIVAYFSSSSGAVAGAFAPLVKFFWSVVDSIAKAFHMLPESVQNAFLAVVQIVKQAALAVYGLFSYLNPFAHHSPSLVENVTNGVAVIQSQFAKVANIGSHFAKASADLHAFGAATAALSKHMSDLDIAEKRASIIKFAPGALPSFNAIIDDVRVLNVDLLKTQQLVNAQQATVDKWSASLDRANDSLDAANSRLDTLQKVADKAKDKLDQQQQKLDDFANAPIKGMQAMSDAIFKNEIAQKKAQLQMMEWEKSNGSLQDLQNTFQSLTGDIDTLKGTITDLRSKGAGSDILGPLQDQLKALQGKQGKTQVKIDSSPYAKMSKQLDDLAKKGQELDLLNSIKFDPLTRQIDQLANKKKELSFTAITNGITASQAAVNSATTAYNNANKAVAEQQRIVDRLTASRDAIKKRYDAEDKKLSQLKSQYQAIEDQISSLKNAYEDLASAAAAASDKLAAAAKKKKGHGGDKVKALGPGAQAFADATGSSFGDIGGSAKIGREGGAGDQSKMIDDFTKQIQEETKGMFGKFDILDPIKKMWGKVVKWLKDKFGPLVGMVGDFFSHIFDNVSFGDIGNKVSGTFDTVTSSLSTAIGTIKDVFNTLSGWASDIWKLIGPPIIQIGKVIWDGLVSAFNKVMDELKQFGPLFQPAQEAFKNLWTIIKPVVAILGGALLLAFSIIVNVIKNVVGPVFDFLGTVIAMAVRVIRGVVEILIGIFTGDFAMIWKGVTDIVSATWNTVMSLIVNFGKLVWGVISGIVEGIIGFFKWLWDELVGHSIIPELVHAVIDWFNRMIKPLTSAASWISKTFSGAFHWVRDKWNSAISAISRAVSDWWNRVYTRLTTAKNYVVNLFSRIWKNVQDAWSNAFSGVTRNVSSWWKGIGDKLSQAKKYITDTFGNAFSEVRKKFSSAWKAITDWFSQSGGSIGKPIKKAINVIIQAINSLIHGLNKLATMMPGMKWKIPDIPTLRLAVGGPVPTRRVGNGFVTQGARAIVGEGKANHPEFVIPTDPTFRSRAVRLWEMLGDRIGARKGGAQELAWGGIIGDAIGDAIGSGGRLLGSLKDEALSHLSDLASWVLKPFRKIADGVIGKIPWDYGKKMAKSVEDRVFSWADVFDKQADKKVSSISGAAPEGNIRSWIMAALHIIQESTALAGGLYRMIMSESGGNPKAINLWDSNAKAGHPSKGLMQTIDSTFNAYSVPGHKNIWNPIDNIIAGTRYAIRNYGRQMIINGGNHGTGGRYVGYDEGGVLGRIPSLAQGAYIRRRAGGTIVRVAEGRNDEMVTPLPAGGIGALGKTENNFYGDLIFPEVKNGGDAKAFITALRSLASGN